MIRRDPRSLTSAPRAAAAARLRNRGALWPAMAAATLVAVSLSGCAPDQEQPSGGTPTSSSRPSAAAGDPEVLASGVQTPWSIVELEDGAVLVSERDTGRIAQLSPDGELRAVASVDGSVHTGEGGLLGLAVHEDQLYAYTTTATDNRILRFPLTRQGGRVELGRARVVIDGLPAAAIHNGGRVAFGPDGMLYATVGDAGDSANAQNVEALGGKILRLQPDGTVPADNPFDGSPVYSFGHRNPQGLAWDDEGTMYAAEFGQNTWDELNVIRPGANYGWPTVEGIAEDDDERFVNPEQQWSTGEASPSGIAVAGDRIYIANLRGRSVRVVPLDDLGSSTTMFDGEYGRIRDVVRRQDGDLWILTSNTDGRGSPADDDDRILRLDLDT